MKTKAFGETRHPCTKRYDKEFRTEAVALLKAGRSGAQLARELGVSSWSLSRWKAASEGAGGAAAGQAGPGGPGWRRRRQRPRYGR